MHQVSTTLNALLPKAELHHIGATAIPGAMTKGDVDLLLRVNASDFNEAVEALRQQYEVKQPQNWDPFFASFGNDLEYDLPLGLQLVIKNSEADFFLFVQDYMASHPIVLSEYNRVKIQSVSEGPGKYWSAKNRVLAPIVALYQERPNQTK